MDIHTTVFIFLFKMEIKEDQVHPHPLVFQAVVYVALSFFLFLAVQRFAYGRIERHCRNHPDPFSRRWYTAFVTIWRIVTAATIVTTATHLHGAQTSVSAVLHMTLVQLMFVCASILITVILDATATHPGESKAEKFGITMAGFFPVAMFGVSAIIACLLKIYFTVA